MDRIVAMPMSAMSNLANGLIIAAPLPGRILLVQRLGRHTTNAAVLLWFPTQSRRMVFTKATGAAKKTW
jgi:hypothetical protein